MMARHSTANIAMMILAGLAAWLVPGAGHWVLREKGRAVIIFVTITLLFLTGIYAGSVAVVDPVRERLWYTAQILTSPVVAVVGRVTTSKGYDCFGRPSEIGQIYTSVAGMLNLLCIINVVYLVEKGKRPVK